MAPIKKGIMFFFVTVTISFICQMNTEVVATRQEFVLDYRYNRAFERSYESPAIISVCFSVYPKLRSLPILPYSNNSSKQHTSVVCLYLVSLLMQFSFQSSQLGTTRLWFPTYT